MTDEHGVAPDYLADLTEFIRIPSISADPSHVGDVWRAGEWVRDFLHSSGAEVHLLDCKGKPLVVGTIRASLNPEEAPAVLVYGHFDVQPADPVELWDSEPFELEFRDGFFYARGIVDDKGLLYMLMRAARDLVREGALPVNLRFVCEGEEEVAGQTVIDFLESDTEHVDAAIIFDGTMSRPDRPEFTVATRGLVACHVTVRTGDHDLHSGLQGGAVLNAAHALMQTLAGVLPVGGRAPEPLRAGLIPPSQAEIDVWQTLTAGEHEIAALGARPADEGAGREFYLRITAEPAVEVNGIAAGSAVHLRTVIPVEASANVSIRLVGGQDVAGIAKTLAELLRNAAPPGAEVDVELMASAPPATVPVDSQAIRLGQDAFEEVFGVRPALIRSGGTMPILGVLAQRGIPTIFTGFTLPDSGVHAPNERLSPQHLRLGAAVSRRLLERLSALRAQA